MRLLVTGGAGFLGANFIRYVLRTTSDVHILNLDALTYAGNLASLAEIEHDPRYSFVRGDVRDRRLVADLIAHVDAVVHLAAESHVDRSLEGPTAFLETNVAGAGAVFEACCRAGVKRVLHVSSGEVYGSVPAPRRAKAGDPLNPSTPHGVSKAGADLLARSYRVTYDYPITVARTTNVYGPLQYPEKLVARFATELIDGRDVPLYGDGDNAFDWLHVDDASTAHWLALTEGEPGRVYDVGTGVSISDRRITEVLLDAFDAGPERVIAAPARPGQDRRRVVDPEALRGLGWEPAWPVEEGLVETARWYRRNEAWWRLLKGSATGRRSPASPSP